MGSRLPAVRGMRAALQGGQQVACSEKCRARRWRQRRETTRVTRDRAIRALLEAALMKLEDA